MKPFHKKLKTFGTGALIIVNSIFLITACSSNTNTNVKADLLVPSQQTVQLASNIISESVSSDDGGLVSGFDDATSVAGKTGFTSSQPSTNTGINMIASNPGANKKDTLRGRASNYKATYNRSNGTHYVNFNRDVNTPKFTKKVSVHLEYIYRDSLGFFLRFPLRSVIYSVDFKGKRKGSVQTPNKISNFTRTDTLFYIGLNGSSPTITINGSHYGHGDFEMTGQNGTQTTKNYTLSFQLVNVTIQKSSILTHNLSQGVTGTLSYDLTLHRAQDTTSVYKHMSGTIIMNGDGTALLKFAHYSNNYLINLKTGAVNSN